MLVITAVVLVLGVVLFPVFSQAKSEPHRSKCLTHLKQIGTSAHMYLADNSDHFPAATRWMDDLLPYGRADSIFRCSSVEAQGMYGYALNRFVAGLAYDSIADPPMVHFAYDSRILDKNATEYLPLMPVPGRHRGASFVVFADGHGKVVITAPK